MNQTYRYPPTLRVLGLFGALLAGGILIGSVLAEIEAADARDLILHGAGAVAGAIILWLGLEFGMRRVTPEPGGLATRLVRPRTIDWGDVRAVGRGPFDVLIVWPRRGLPIVIWPFLDEFGALLDVLTKQVVHPRS